MAASIYENVKRAIQDIVAPELRTLQGQIETMRVEMHGRIENLRVETQGGIENLRSEIRRLDEKIDSVNKRIDGLEEQIRNLRAEVLSTVDVHERIAAIEAKLSSR